MGIGEATDEQQAGLQPSAALAALAECLDRLIASMESGGCNDWDGLGLIEFLRGFERVRNRMSLVDHVALEQADRQGLAQQLTHQSMTSVLVQALRLSPGGASRRIRAAAAVGRRHSMLGEPLDPLLPHLAAAQRSGDVSAEQVAVVERAIRALDRPGLERAQVEQAERVLTAHAGTFGPVELQKIATRLVDCVDPDGTLPAEQLCRDRRDLHLSRLRDGSCRLEGRLTPALAAQLSAVLSPLAKPRVTSVARPDGSVVLEPDERTPGQRTHDALEEVCGRLLRVGGLPASGGTPATVIVTIEADKLRDRVGHGVTSDGTVLPVADVLRLANEAEIRPAVLTTSGVLLELGRSRRVANQNQTLALIARDGGCSFPGCSHPPDYCDRHHIKEWMSGGKTDLRNLTLLCRYHHTHFVGHGWTCRMNAQQLPEWTPPVWVDPRQRARVNDRIRSHHVLVA